MPAITKADQAVAAKHVSEGAERVANLFGRSLVEGRHKQGCQCGFCKNMGSFGKKKKEDTSKEPSEPTEPEKKEVEEAFQGKVMLNKPGSGQWRKPSSTCSVCGRPRQGVADRRLRANEVCSPECLKKKHSAPMGAYLPTPPASMRTAWHAQQESGSDVKLSKGNNLGGPAAKAYSKMTSKQAMTPEWKPKAYIKAAGELSGMNKSGQMKGFKNKSAGETTSGKKLPKTRAGESVASALAANQIVEALLD
jgi:hypothetical protein